MVHDGTMKHPKYNHHFPIVVGCNVLYSLCLSPSELGLLCYGLYSLCFSPSELGLFCNVLYSLCLSPSELLCQEFLQHANAGSVCGLCHQLHPPLLQGTGFPLVRSQTKGNHGYSVDRTLSTELCAF